MSGMAFEVMMAAPFAEAQERVIEALKAEGFGVLTRIDVHDTLKAVSYTHLTLPTTIKPCGCGWGRGEE